VYDESSPLPPLDEDPFPPEETEDVADGRRRFLDPEYVPAARLTNWIVTASLTVGVGIGFVILLFRADWGTGTFAVIGSAALVFLLACAWLSHAWPRLEFRRISWRIDAEGIEIKRGVVWRHVIVVPRTRIQHTDVSQGPIQRRFGLATLLIHTAGTHQYEVNLEGLSRPTAFAVRDALLVSGMEDGA
jgi:membrane protein YdbS with pleckstrin-like domain